MLGKTPAIVALAAVFTAFAAAGECAAQSDSQTAQEAQAETAKFNAWRDRFRARALKAGIPHDVFEKALGHVRPDPTVHEKDQDQPEFTRPIWDYLDGALSESRIKNGRKMLRRHASLLADAERTWGVPRQFLVAIWGMETSYGALLGDHNIFEALATLSYRGDRTEYGEEQLLAALRLLADGEKPLEAMKGSWAGAVGHTQFVPTTYLKYAVDGDKDGHRDLWDSLSDVFHSTANYLKKSGFDPNLKWGREAFLPDKFDYTLAGYQVTKPLREWRDLGIRMANGAPVPALDIKASILVPAGHQGPAFLIYGNFQAILAYNNSTSYALAIGLLSDQLKGGPSLKKSWPRHLKPLARDDRIEIQRRLKELGYTVSKLDGVLGRETRSAIQAFQKDQGDVADGYATSDTLAKLRAASPAETASVAPAAAESAAKPEESARTAEVAMLDGGRENADTDGAEEGGAKNVAGVDAKPNAGDETRLDVKSDSGGGSGTGDDVGSDTGQAAGAEMETGADAGPDPAAKPGVAPESLAAKTVAVAVPAEARAEMPLPRAKPVIAAAEASPSPHGSVPDAVAIDIAARPGGATPRKKPNFGGVTSALAAPGLTLMGNGMAAPFPRPAQSGKETAASGKPAASINNGDEPIVSPPGVAYVGTPEEKEQAEAGTSQETPGNGNDEAESAPGDGDDSGEPEEKSGSDRES